MDNKAYISEAHSIKAFNLSDFKIKANPSFTFRISTLYISIALPFFFFLIGSIKPIDKIVTTINTANDNITGKYPLIVNKAPAITFEMELNI